MRVKAATKQAIVSSRLLRWMSSLKNSSVIVLRYHSVLEDPAEAAYSIGAGIIHSAEVFARQMEYIARECKPVSIEDVLSFVRKSTELPRRAVVVTFDDGFADNLEVACPILQRFDISGVVYVAGSYIGSIPWYSRIRYAFFTSSKDIFNDPFDGTTVRIGNDNARYEAFLKCSRFCAKSDAADIDGKVAAIERALEVKLEPRKPLMLDWEGVRQLSKAGQTIGSHTMTHPNLAYVSREEVLAQMHDSRELIEKNVGHKIKHFSYPSPIMEPHWTNHTARACSEAGYETAVTCTIGAVGRNDDPLTLRRISAPASMDEFVWKLENEFAGRHV